MLFFINVISSRRARLHEFASLHDPVQLHIYTNTYCTFKDPDFTITQLKHLYAYKPQSVHNQFTVKVGLPSNKRHISRTSSSIRSLKGFPIVNLDVLQLHWIGLDWTALDPHQDNHQKSWRYRAANEVVGVAQPSCRTGSWVRGEEREFFIYILHTAIRTHIRTHSQVRSKYSCKYLYHYLLPVQRFDSCWVQLNLPPHITIHLYLGTPDLFISLLLFIILLSRQTVTPFSIIETVRFQEKLSWSFSWIRCHHHIACTIGWWLFLQLYLSIYSAYPAYPLASIPPFYTTDKPYPMPEPQ